MNLAGRFAATRVLICCGLFFGATAHAAERTVELRSTLAALESITAADLQNHVEVLAADSFEGREAGSRGGRAAGTYLVRLFEKHGLTGGGEGRGFVQSFGNGYRNVLGVLPGSDPTLKHEIIIVCAHYDHVGYGSRGNSYGPTGYIHNGADDNASGTSAILEIVEAFGHLPQPPRRTMLFALWDGEEKGLLGSKHWTSHPTARLDRVALVINADMIGRLRGRRLEMLGTRTMRGLRRLVSGTNRDIGLDINFTWQLKSNSDHYSFYVRNIPVLMVHTGLHDDYHRPTDDAYKINADGMQQVTRLLFNVAREAGDGAPLSRFRTASRNETSADRVRLERPMAQRPSRLGVRWDSRAERGRGLLLTYIRPGSAADRAGLRSGDRLLKLGDREVVDGVQLRADVLSAQTEVEVEILRPPGQQPQRLSVQLDGKPTRVGISWRIDQAEPQTAVVTLIVPGAPAQRAGLQLGDRIYEVAGGSFAGSDELFEMLITLPSPVELEIERRGRLQQIVLQLPDLPRNVAASTE